MNSDDVKPDSDEKDKRKTSIWLFLSFVCVSVSAILILFIDPYVALLIACAGIFSAIKAIKEIKKNNKKASVKIFAIVAIVLQAVIFIVQAYWRIDAPPITNDYTISDIKSAPHEFNESYELLLDLADTNENSYGAPAIGLSEDDLITLNNICDSFKDNKYEDMCRAIDSNSENILMLWNKSKKGREVINRLSTYDEIADLTEPDIEYDIKYLKNLRTMVQIHRAYIYLQCTKSNFDNATRELIKLNTLNRKLNSNARSLVTKLVCMAIGSLNMQTAVFVINNPNLPRKDLEEISINFRELEQEQTSMRNQMIFEYLMAKNTFKMIIDNTIGNQEMPFKDNFFFTNILKKRISNSMFKYNSSLRLARNYCNHWLAVDEGKEEDPNGNFNVWPIIYPNLPVETNSDGQLPKYYTIYNPIGSSLIGILAAYERVFEVRTKYIVQDDLLQIVINKRLGKPYNQEVKGFGDKCIIDYEQEKIFNPGPDGKDYTDDDIYLLINPKVFQEQ